MKILVIADAGEEARARELCAVIEGWDSSCKPELVCDPAGHARMALLDRGVPVTPAQFAEAVGSGDAEAVRLFLAAGFSADAKDAGGVPMVCVAARAGQQEIVRALIAAKADVNQRSDDRGNTALVDAALGKQASIIQDLLAAGADVNARSKDGQSALIIAVGLTDLAVAEALLAAGARADEPDALGATARKYAKLFHNDQMLALFDRYAPEQNA